MDENELKEYYQQLVFHDWFYEYSDDHSVWQRGSDKERQLMSDARKDKRAEALFERIETICLKVVTNQKHLDK